MTPKQLSYGILRALGIAALICFALYFLWLIRSVFAYLAIAFVLAMIGRPLMNLMHNKLKIPNWIGSIVTISLFVFLIFAFVSLFISLVLNEPYRLLGNFIHMDRFEDAVSNQIKLLSDSLGFLNIPLLESFLNDAVKNVNIKSFSGMFGDSITTLGVLMIDTFSVMFITFFFLRDRDLINKMIVAIAPKGEEMRFENVLDKTKDLLSRYFIGLTLQVLIMFTFYFIILLSFGINYAAVIALICALLNPLPYIGPLLGGVIMASLSMSDLHGLGLDFRAEIIPTVLWIMFWYTLTHVWDNFINQPLIYSRSVKSNPLEIFLVILIGGILFGVIGVAIAVPAYTVLRVVLKEFFSEYKIVQSITKNL
ncbi:AI-2E family transporter [Moheibacter lacus]|uniref:AI-2E family transporter n=1 Tax=Moheibacter lacus TaxID=2745851 RepID=A0A838ZNK5_9FLAO|nr:AI-2E family transporter [Moheibacter lacus]MBA5628255.1 AI-2E family transporter [Moheibacter lacus]